MKALRFKIFILLLSSCFFGIAQIPTDGLIAYFPLDGNANDESGNGNNGMVHGATLTTDRCGRVDSAYYFNGIDNYIFYDPSFLLNCTRGTISAWVKIADLTRTQYIGFIGDENGTDTYISLLRFDPSYKTMSIYTHNQYGGAYIKGSTTINADVFYHMVMTGDGSSWNIYINGVKEVLTSISGPNSGACVKDLSNVDHFLLGTNKFIDNYSTAYFKGTLDDVRVYNRVLSDDEINGLYNTNCNSCRIDGTTNVCKGQKDVKFQAVNMNNAVSYSWSYDGTGVSINNASNLSYLTFGENATSGNLRVIGTKINGIDRDTSILAITVNPCNDNCLVGLQNGLVAYYPFNGNANDESGNGNNGVVHGATLIADQCGRSDSAYYFNGIDNYIKVSGASGINNNNFTYSLWLKPYAIPSYGNASSFMEIGSQNYSGGKTGQCFSINNNYVYTTGWRVTSGNESAGSVGFQSDVLPNANTWYHWVVVRNDTEVKLYINNIHILSRPTNGQNPYYESPLDIFIGNRGDLNLYQFYHGIIDDIRFYNRALDENEIDCLYKLKCSTVSIGKVSGKEQVCQGEQNVIYSVPAIADANSYTWNYSGSGATFNGNSNIVSISFDNNATSGSITVTANMNDGSQLISDAFSVLINKLPEASGYIGGMNEVCSGLKGVNYLIWPIENATTYIWDFSGSGGTIVGNTENIIVNFDDNATPGYLSVKGSNNCGVGTISPPFPITFNNCTQIGNISGAQNVCQGDQNVFYSITSTANALDYNWYYSGTGVTFNVNSNIASASFNNNATSGYITVTANLSDGSKSISEAFLVIVEKLPEAGIYINGENEVCIGQRGENYSVLPIENATNYIWNYSGSGAVIIGNSENIIINFADSATPGNLTVKGWNSCGEGSVSPEFAITFKTCYIEPEEVLNIPNSYSPNGDGINDCFVIRGLPQNSKLMVFNRFGLQVYKSDNYNNDWNGIDEDGNILGTDTYYYILIIPTIPNEFKGYIFLKK